MLLDADVVIRLFELGIWDRLVRAAQVSVARTVLDETMCWYDPDTMARKCIVLQPDIAEGRITVIDCDANEVAPVSAACEKFSDLHAGELESLAIMCRPGQSALFCTADGGAIRAAVLLDLLERTVSLEELLKQVGLGRDFSGRENQQFSERRFQQSVRLANIDKIQGMALE